MSYEKISDLELSKEAFKAVCAIAQLYTSGVHQHLANKILFNNAEFIRAIGQRVVIYHSKITDKNELLISLKAANLCYKSANKLLTSKYLSTQIYDVLEDLQFDHCQ